MEDRIHLLTTSLNKHYSMGMNRPATAVTVSAQITPPFDADISKLKEALIMYRQHERFINELAGTLTELKLNIDKLLKAFREKLNDVHETVKYRIAISTEKIFVSWDKITKEKNKSLIGLGCSIISINWWEPSVIVYFQLIFQLIFLKSLQTNKTSKVNR